MKGHTSTGSVGIGIGPIGVGGADSFSRMRGTMESTGRSRQEKDRAVDIDEGQLQLTADGMKFVGKLQVREIPVESILQIGVEQDVLVVASTVSALALRFRFRERFEADVFGRVVSQAVQTGTFPDLGKFEEEITAEAVRFRSSQIESLGARMQAIAQS